MTTGRCSSRKVFTLVITPNVLEILIRGTFLVVVALCVPYAYRARARLAGVLSLYFFSLVDFEPDMC